MFIPEILAPGGSFNTSIHAFEAGADAIYAGMSSFSARKGAANFTLERLRRLKNYTENKKKKIYIALNTVIKQNELEEIILLLHHLEEAEVDGIILQDLGLARILREHFPGLERHASTQMAVHNSRGVEVLKQEGFSRIILARELTLKEIEIIRKDHRDIELEVFIHGAMCYSFSGICLASGRLLGRSGNRGECGQICRTWFDGEEKHRFAFSANDLKAGEEVLKLRDLGIDSLKIEGRLKSPAYVSHTVAYYRSLLDGSGKKASDSEDQASAIAFSRNQTSAFFENPKGLSMVNNDYASHTGLPAGQVVGGGKRQYKLKAFTDLSDRDGLLIFHKGEPHQFALKTRGNKSHYKKGEVLDFFYKGQMPTGTEVSLVSRHDMQLKEHKEESYKPWKSPVDLTIQVEKDKLTITPYLKKSHLSPLSYPVDCEASRSPREVSDIIEKAFSKSGDTPRRTGALKVENQTKLPSDGIFINPGQLKQTRQQFFKDLDQKLEKVYRESAQAILEKINREWQGLSYESQESLIPGRKEMGTFGPGSMSFIPLPPLQFSEEDFTLLKKEIEQVAAREGKVVIGINNISHLSLIQDYSERDDVFFFTDYCTYIANKSAALFYRDHCDRLLFSYYWIEDKEDSLSPLREIEIDFNPHLFVSRICYRLHNGLGRCGDCGRDYSYELNQRERQFQVVVKDCLTWLYQKE